MQRQIRDQRGSVSPVFLTLLSLCLLLMAAFLDREWANYMMKLAEQTADFAAESGARAHQSWATVEMTKRQVRQFTEAYCTGWNEAGECTDFGQRSWTETYWDWPVVEIRHEELLRDSTWRERHFQCGPSAAYPAWECYYARVVHERITYTAEAEPLAATTFDLNWKQRSAARVHRVTVFPLADKATVEVQVQMEIRSLFGMLGWRRDVLIEGAAATQIPPIQLN